MARPRLAAGWRIKRDATGRPIGFERTTRPGEGLFTQSGTAPGIKFGQGWGQQTSSNGQRRLVKPGFASGVSLAQGWGIQYDANGKPQSFQRTNQAGTGSAAAAQPAAAAQDAPLTDDAQSLAARARAIFDVTQQRQGLEQQGAYDTTDLGEAIRRLQVQQPRDTQTAREAANRQGLFYSGALSRNLDDLKASYLQRQGDLQQSYDRRKSARQSAIEALAQSEQISNQEIDAALADRLTAGDLAAADEGVLAPEDAPAATTAAAPAAKTWKPVIRNGWVWHDYPDGRKVRVRKATH